MILQKVKSKNIVHLHTFSLQSLSENPYFCYFPIKPGQDLKSHI